MTDEQASEVLRMIMASVNKRFAWMQHADRQDLAGYSWEQVYKYHKPSHKHTAPTYWFCDCFVKSQYIKRGYIKSRSRGSYEMDDEEKYPFGIATNRDVISINELYEITGWEPSVPCIETMIIERSKRTVYERMVQHYLDNPWQSVKIKSAIKHIENGGNLKAFATEIGMSGQTLKNKIQRAVRQASEQYLALN